MTFESILTSMAIKPGDNIKIINKRLTRGVLKVNVDVICCNLCESRAFFYVTNISQLCDFIPELKPTDVILIVMIFDDFNPYSFFEPDCKFFIRDFNSLPNNDYSFIHSLDTCPEDNTYGVGITVLNEVPFIPRKGTKPKKSKANKKYYKFSKGKNNKFNMTVSTMWIRMENNVDYELKDTQFVLKIVESPKWIVDNTPVLKPL